MIRKTLFTILLFVLTVSTPMVSEAFRYPDHYLNGDSNFPVIWARMGTAFYLDKSSLYSERYDPPDYILSVNVVEISGYEKDNSTISDVINYRLYYQYDSRRMYVYDRGVWRYMPPGGSNAESGMPMYIGEAIFHMYYGIRFYGSKGSSAFNDNFYNEYEYPGAQ